MSSLVTRFYNCRLLRNHTLVDDELWIQGSIIINPEIHFFQTRKPSDESINCHGAIISPGFIDVQMNGGFGIDFSYDITDVEAGLDKVAKGILAHGVTSFCPTLVSSAPEIYQKVLPYLKKCDGGTHGAQVLGAHVEGPFISAEKKGAHDAHVLEIPIEGMASIEKMYSDLSSVAMVTIAPELPKAFEVIEGLVKQGIVASLGEKRHAFVHSDTKFLILGVKGHSMANIAEGEEGVRCGATFITHLFNAMLPFHHRDPGLVGLLASDQLPVNTKLFYGIIADGNHTHPSTTRIAHRANKKGVVLVTDACSAMGLHDGVHHIGQQVIEVQGTKAVIQGTNTLCGSVATMISCVHYFWKTTECEIVEALEAATLHPAHLMGIQKEKGTLAFGSHADLVFLTPQDLKVISTWIAGKCVYTNENISIA